MPDLLLELLSEEIPARMQASAARDLERLVVGALSDRGLLFEGIKTFAGPRRLTLVISGLPAKQADVKEERKGPRVGAPDKAIEGFLRGAGVSLDQCLKQNDGKGEFYVAVIEREGRETAAVLAEILPEAMAKLPWPKSMRWKPGVTTRWVRPLHSILCTFDGETVPFSFAGVSSGRHTLGHRFLSPGKIEVRRFDDYAAALKKAHVVLDAEERAAIVFEGVKQAAFIHGLELIPDEALLAEVSGLVEWPVVLIGTIEDQFMDLPPEVLQTSMRTHQKYFALSDPPTSNNKTGKMANRFALVANMVAEDGGKEIVAGNERVLRARLFDAKFFWDEDRKKSLDERTDSLEGVIFYAQLGTQLERVERIREIAAEIASGIGADVVNATRAAKLAKADLVSGMVGEFPELQGIMGRYYALHFKEAPEVADAIRDHYKPTGPGDAVPRNPVSIAVAVADKIDAITSFFWIDERPTGSGDPYALRRAALGIIRIILQNGIRLSLRKLINLSMWARIYNWDNRYNSVVILGPEFEDERELDDQGAPVRKRSYAHVRSPKSLEEFSIKEVGDEIAFVSGDMQGFDGDEYANFFEEGLCGFIDPAQNCESIVSFFADRLKVALKDQGTRHDLIDAVFALGHEDDLVRLVARVEALQALLKTDDGVNLLAGYKRAANILKAEEKKDAKTFAGTVDERKLAEPAEKTLFAALKETQAAIAPALEMENFADAMRQLAILRGPVDAFFEGVKVNAEDAKLRENRLHLLAALRAAVHVIGDFSKIEG